MALNDVIPEKVVYTTDDDIYQELIIPLLKHSKTYARGVAYFHCEWIILAREGLDEFVENGGKMRLLTSVQIEEEEFEAFKRGQEAKINDILRREIIDRLKKEYANKKQWALDYLSYLISHNILEIKISLHRRSHINIYHDKLSFFSDGSDTICLHGSLNDSQSALENQESINVFYSSDLRDRQRIEAHKANFEADWTDRDKKYATLSLPDIIKKDIVSLGTSKRVITSKPHSRETYPPDPRDYQEKAVQALKENGWNGVLEMATGTGKTWTSLFAAGRLMEEEGEKVLCVVVPQLHLIEQWKKDLEIQFPESAIILCAENRYHWTSPLFRYVKRSSAISYRFIIITTYYTLLDETFRNATSILEDKILYVFDECHKLGTNQIMKKFHPHPGTNRIGLSATPSRWLDPVGNAFIEDTIGKTVYSFDLKEAIERERLTPYDYHPHLVELTLEEFAEFNRLTDLIARMTAREKTKEVGFSETTKRKLNERARLVKKAQEKFQAFFNVFDYAPKKATIVYVFDEQVPKMLHELKERYNLKVHGIVAETKSEERAKILKAFNRGEIDVLVAIKCLDEGVDIENCQYAYLLASSTNPREFIQRRGRVLRKAFEKRKSHIHDFVTIAPEDYPIEDERKENVIVRELPRVAEFVRLASNTPESDRTVSDYVYNLGIYYKYSEMNPWDLQRDEKIDRGVDEDG